MQILGYYMSLDNWNFYFLLLFQDLFTYHPGDVTLLNLGKKTDLLNLAKHYKLSEIKSSMRKHEIKNILVQYFVDEEIFNENALSLIVDVQSVSSSNFRSDN